MLRHTATALAAAALLVAPGTIPAQSCPTPQPRTALVLSGGGAKGLVHIGVLRVLDSLGIRPDLVVGSSMGAIIGGMYASGYTGHEIDSLARALPISDLFLTYQPAAPRSLGLLPPLIVWEQSTRGFTVQTAAVREAEVAGLVSAALLRGNLIARGDFDRLPIPFRAVATDLADRSPVVLASGDLAQAVRASFAIPLVFPPERIDGHVLSDGGLAANIPVAVARAAGAKRVIVVDATEPLSDSVDLFSPIVVADRLLTFLFRQPPDTLNAGDVVVRPDVRKFRSLDFTPTRVADLIERGRTAAAAALTYGGCAKPAGPKPAPLRLGAVTTLPDPSDDRETLLRTIGLLPHQRRGSSGRGRDTLDVLRVRQRLRRLGESDRYREVWLNPTGRGDSIAFDVVARRAPRRVAGLGLAYDNELGGRLWVGAADRGIAEGDVEASAALLLGELRRDATLGLWRHYRIGLRTLSPTITARATREKIRQFDTAGTELPEVTAREAVGFVGVEYDIAPRWLAAVGGEGRLWREPARGNAEAVGAAVRLQRVGPGSDRLVLLEGSWTTVYRRALLEAGMPLRLGTLRLRPRLRVAVGDSLPLQLAQPLGGDDGFPGLRLGERRGDREAMFSLQAAQPILGPLLVRVEAAVGRSAVGGPLLGDAGWVAGVRAGLGADTPLGPVRFEYGVATGGRDAVFVRLGRWF